MTGVDLNTSADQLPRPRQTLSFSLLFPGRLPESDGKYPVRHDERFLLLHLEVVQSNFKLVYVRTQRNASMTN